MHIYVYNLCTINVHAYIALCYVDVLFLIVYYIISVFLHVPSIKDRKQKHKGRIRDLKKHENNNNNHDIKRSGSDEAADETFSGFQSAAVKPSDEPHTAIAAETLTTAKSTLDCNTTSSSAAAAKTAENAKDKAECLKKTVSFDNKEEKQHNIYHHNINGSSIHYFNHNNNDNDNYHHRHHHHHHHHHNRRNQVSGPAKGTVEGSDLSQTGEPSKGTDPSPVVTLITLSGFESLLERCVSIVTAALRSLPDSFDFGYPLPQLVLLFLPVGTVDPPVAVGSPTWDDDSGCSGSCWGEAIVNSSLNASFSVFGGLVVFDSTMLLMQDENNVLTFKNFEIIAEVNYKLINE